MAGMGAHQSAVMLKDEWLTPPEIIKALGRFDLDPCAPVCRPWDTAYRHYTIHDNGLAQAWRGRVLLTISDDDTITPCQQNCRHQHINNAPNAERSNLSPWSISVPVPADHSDFFHVAGSAWHKPTQNESGSSASLAQVSAASTSNQGSINAQNAIASSLQLSNSLAQNQNAVMDLHRGAENVQENWQETIEQSYEPLSQGNRRSRKNGRDTPNPILERKQSNQAQESITPSADREELTYRLSGSIPTGWTASLPSEMPAHIVAQLGTCTKTTSSHYHIMNVPELSSETWSQPANYAICQKVPSIRVRGLKEKLLSLGLLTPCGCFVGEYKPRVWCNPPYGSETGKWLKRLVDHGDGIALIFARTETRMFFDHAWNYADAVFFFEGRLHFHHVDGRRAAANAGAPSCLVAYGSANRRAIRCAVDNDNLRGMLVEL